MATNRTAFLAGLPVSKVLSHPQLTSKPTCTTLLLSCLKYKDVNVGCIKDAACSGSSELITFVPSPSPCCCTSYVRYDMTALSKLDWSNTCAPQLEQGGELVIDTAGNLKCPCSRKLVPVPTYRRNHPILVAGITHVSPWELVRLPHQQQHQHGQQQHAQQHQQHQHAQQHQQQWPAAGLYNPMQFAMGSAPVALQLHGRPDPSHMPLFHPG